jgi:hypothetical protein
MTVATEQHMDGWAACISEWEESHLNWDLGKKEVHQWFDHHLKWQGVKRIVKNVMQVPHRVYVCHTQMKVDRPRKRQMKTQFWDELLLGNVWTHTEPILADLKDMRVAWNSHSYAKAGKHFGQALFKLYGGLVPEDESARMPMVTVDNMMPSDLATGLYYGVTGEYLETVPQLDEQFANSITAAIEDLATLSGAGLTSGFLKATTTYAQFSNFAIPDEKTILHNVKAHLPELLMDIAKLKKDIFSKNYLAAGKLLGEMFALISEPITAVHMDMEDLE